MSKMGEDLTKAVRDVAREWKREKRHADRNDHVSRESIRWLRSGSRRATLREVAFRVMEDAYNHASSNGKFYANARQIMYAARPRMLALERSLSMGKRFSGYFTQTLLKDYLEQHWHPEWRVVWDARGHLTEPYTNTMIGLGGIEVLQYIKGWAADFKESPEVDLDGRIDTSGPVNRFGAVLFVEKEGFTETFADAGIGKRYDMAIMSTKGLPVKAACDLANAFQQRGVRVYVLHDFDLAGFKIVRTLREGTRMARGSDVIDLGFRIADVGGLEPEPVDYKQGRDPRWYLEECGANLPEQAFLVQGRAGGGWYGRRVELNAMTSEQLIAWLERKLAEHGVKKLLPKEDVLSSAYRRAQYVHWLQAQIDAMKDKPETVAPEGLAGRVGKYLDEHPTESWDDAVWSLSERDSTVEQ